MASAHLLLALALGAAAAPDAAVLAGVLEVHERAGGCGGEADSGLRTHVEGSRTTFEQDIWLSSRESLDPIDVLQVAREGTTLIATVNVHVAETEPGRPDPACIRPVNLRLHIEGLPPGDYTLQLRRAES
jgi:hypothetical protein